MTSAEEDFGAFFESLLEGDQAVSRGGGGRSPAPPPPPSYFQPPENQSQQQVEKLKQLVDQRQQQHAAAQWLGENAAQQQREQEARKEHQHLQQQYEGRSPGQQQLLQQQQIEGRPLGQQQLEQQQQEGRPPGQELLQPHFLHASSGEQQQKGRGGDQRVETVASSLSNAALVLSNHEEKQRQQQQMRMQHAPSSAAASAAAAGPPLFARGDNAAPAGSEAATRERRQDHHASAAAAAPATVRAAVAAAAAAAVPPRDRAAGAGCVLGANPEGSAAAAAGIPQVVPPDWRGPAAAEAVESLPPSSVVKRTAHTALVGPRSAAAAACTSAAATASSAAEASAGGAAAGPSFVNKEPPQMISAPVAYVEHFLPSNKLAPAAAPPSGPTSLLLDTTTPTTFAPAAVATGAGATREAAGARAHDAVLQPPSADAGEPSSSRPLQQRKIEQSVGKAHCSNSSSSSGPGSHETSSNSRGVSGSSSSDSVYGDPLRGRGCGEETSAKTTVKSRRAAAAAENSAAADAAAPASSPTPAAAATGEPGSMKAQQNQQQRVAAMKRAAAGETVLQELCQPPGRKTCSVILPQLELEDVQQQQQQEHQRQQRLQQQAGRLWWSAPPELDPYPPYRFSMREAEVGRDEACSSRISSNSSSSSKGSILRSAWNNKNISSKASSSKSSDCKTETPSDRGGTTLETVQQDMAFSAEAISRVIEAKLLENQQMIFAIHENLSGGRFEQAVCFFERLQQNLLFLALLADQQPEQQLGKLPVAQQQKQCATEGDDIGEQQQDAFQDNADLWNDEETQRLYHALRTPYLDLRQLSAAVCSKDPQQVLTYLMRTADGYLNYSRGIPNVGFGGDGALPPGQLPQLNSRGHAGQQEMLPTADGSGERRLATQSTVPCEPPKFARTSHHLTVQSTGSCSESTGVHLPQQQQQENLTGAGSASSAARAAVQRHILATELHQQPDQQKQQSPVASSMRCYGSGPQQM